MQKISKRANRISLESTEKATALRLIAFLLSKALFFLQYCPSPIHEDRLPCNKI
jgi:hypothetical protein